MQWKARISQSTFLSVCLTAAEKDPTPTTKEPDNEGTGRYHSSVVAVRHQTLRIYNVSIVAVRHLTLKIYNVSKVAVTHLTED